MAELSKSVPLREAAVYAVGLLNVLPNAPATEPRLAQHAMSWVAVFERAGFGGEAMRQAAVRCLAECKFFPTPAEMLEKANEWLAERPLPKVNLSEALQLPSPRGVPLAERADREQMERLRARLDELFARVAPSKRQRAERPAFDDSPEDPNVEARRALLRQQCSCGLLDGASPGMPETT